MSEYSKKFFKVSHLGLCNGMPTDWFYPEQHMDNEERAKFAKAIQICNDCPIKETCYDHAVRHEDHGVWAGTTPRERRNGRRKLNIEFESLAQESGVLNILWDKQ